MTIPNCVHLIGIGGIGVSGVARALLAMGHQVQGSDVRESQLTLALRDLGATVHIGHSADHLDGADVIVRSTAIPDGNPELVAANERGLTVWHRSELLGAILATRPVSVGVVGTHGKGTVSSAITWILETAGRNPSFIIGGLLENFGKLNTRITDSDIIVAEVDESDGSLANIHPTVVVINNLEADHLNYYDSLEHVQDTVVAALNNNTTLTHVILNHDCPGARALIGRLNVPITTFGRETEAAVRGIDAHANISGGRATLVTADGGTIGDIHTSVPGLYNLDNAIAAATAGLHLGAAPATLNAALSQFRGLENRFTVVEAGERKIVKDYISHPTGIRRVLQAAASDSGRITAVFKPYRFTMINYLQDDYADAFHDANHTIITELYTAGEVPIPGIDTEFLCNKIRSRGPTVSFIEAMDDIIPNLHETVKPGEQVIFFGGDDLFELADRYAEELKTKAKGP